MCAPRPPPRAAPGPLPALVLPLAPPGEGLLCPGPAPAARLEPAWGHGPSSAARGSSGLWGPWGIAPPGDPGCWQQWVRGCQEPGPQCLGSGPALVSLVSRAGATVRGEHERGFGVLWWCRQVGAGQRPGHPLVRLGSVTWSWSVSVPWGRGGLGPRGPVTVLGGCRGSGCGVGRGVGGPCGAGVRPAVPLHKSGSRGGRGSLLPWKPAR